MIFQNNIINKKQIHNAMGTVGSLFDKAHIKSSLSRLHMIQLQNTYRDIVCLQ